MTNIVLGWVLGLVLPALVHAQTPAVRPASEPIILVVGDSLSAGYRIAVDAAWVTLLQQRLAAQGYGYRVVNASVSGETTGGARARLTRALKVHSPAIVVLELGANDGLRGLPLRQVRENLEFMIEGAQAAQAKVVLVGMRMPPNYGTTYTNQFHALYGELARKYQLPLVDFFLEGVALDEKLMQTDGLHPTAGAQPRLLDNLWPALEQVLKK